MAQDERRGFEIVKGFPFMLRLSKHSEPFFSTLLELRVFASRANFAPTIFFPLRPLPPFDVCLAGDTPSFGCDWPPWQPFHELFLPLYKRR